MGAVSLELTNTAGHYYVPLFSFDDFGQGALAGFFTTRMTITLVLASSVVPLSRQFSAGPTLNRPDAPVVARAGVMLVALPASLLLIAAGAFSPFLYFQF